MQDELFTKVAHDLENLEKGFQEHEKEFASFRGAYEIRNDSLKKDIEEIKELIKEHIVSSDQSDSVQAAMLTEHSNRLAVAEKDLEDLRNDFAKLQESDKQQQKLIHKGEGLAMPLKWIGAIVLSLLGGGVGLLIIQKLFLQ